MKPLAKGDSYAVHTGAYAGELLIFVKQEKESLCFLSVPAMINREISHLIFDNARNKGIIKYVERVPKYVQQVSFQQYKINEISPNRRKQSDSPNILDSK